VLLLALQGFWLRSVYHDEQQRLNKDLHTLFREVVFSMSDSLFKKNISALPSPQDFAQIKDSLRIFASQGHLKNKISISDTSVQVVVFTESGKDSLDDFIKPLTEKIKGSRGKRAFSINLTGEKLSEKELNKKFAKAMEKAKYPIPFALQPMKRQIDFPLKLPRVRDEQTVFTPAGGFKAEFTNTSGYVVKRMSPQILFSLFLTALTTISFWVMFKNIRAQQRLAELKNDFISNMTHELKTPVTTVGVALEALKNFKGLENPTLTQEYLTIAQNELNRLSLLTDKILKTSVFENRGVEYEPEVMDLAKIVEQTAQSLKLVFEKTNATVSIEKEGSDFTLRGGVVHITNVIYNLLDNALKYSLENPQITISLKEDTEQLIVSVKDKGVGIASEFKKKIFEKFFRVPTGNVHTVKGYGLGLNYVDAVVKAHKGTITVESELGKGSSFIITLPK
jgi:two-component system, OmpR family, phosphate regulon sensor histidine kinase PhoR